MKKLQSRILAIAWLVNWRACLHGQGQSETFGTGFPVPESRFFTIYVYIPLIVLAHI